MDYNHSPRTSPRTNSLMTRETKKMMETQRNALRSGLVHERPRRHAHDKESE